MADFHHALSRSNYFLNCIPPCWVFRDTEASPWGPLVFLSPGVLEGEPQFLRRTLWPEGGRRPRPRAGDARTARARAAAAWGADRGAG